MVCLGCGQTHQSRANPRFPDRCPCCNHYHGIHSFRGCTLPPCSCLWPGVEPIRREDLSSATHVVLEFEKHLEVRRRD